MHVNPCCLISSCLKCDRSYVNELSNNANCETDLLLSHLTRILRDGQLHAGPHKTTELSKLGMGTCTEMDTCLRQYGIYTVATGSMVIKCMCIQCKPGASSQLYGAMNKKYRYSCCGRLSSGH